MFLGIVGFVAVSAAVGSNRNLAILFNESRFGLSRNCLLLIKRLMQL